METSISSPSLAATALPRVTVCDPPPAGTVPEPDELVVPLFRATEMAAFPQAEAIWLTVTLITLAPERFCRIPTPSVSHCPTAALFPPRDWVPGAREAAWPTTNGRTTAAIPKNGRSEPTRRRRTTFPVTCTELAG